MKQEVGCLHIVDIPIPDHTFYTAHQKALDEIHICVTWRVQTTSSSMMLVQASQQNVGYPKKGIGQQQKTIILNYNFIFFKKKALPHHKYENKQQQPPYIDHVPLTFLSTTDHILLHLADPMIQVSGNIKFINQKENAKGIQK